MVVDIGLDPTIARIGGLQLAWNLAVVALLVVLLPRLRHRGDIFLIATLGYALGRFLLTFFRQEPIVALGLQEAQIVAILTAALVVTLFVVTRRPVLQPSCEHA